MDTALITGASSGIGLALAWRLARNNHKVALLARRADLLAQAVDAMTAEGHTALAIASDVLDAAAVQAAVQRATEELGPIDVAVANAGIAMPTPVASLNPEDVRNIMGVNFLGAVNLVHAVVPGMIARRAGRVVGVASLAGLRALPGHAAYTASKAALQTFMETARVELASHGVGVTIVNPGFVATAMTAGNRFSMPFLMSAEQAAQIIALGIEKGVSEVNFPFAMTAAMRLVRTLPNWIYDELARRAFPKVAPRVPDRP